MTLKGNSTKSTSIIREIGNVSAFRPSAQNVAAHFSDHTFYQNAQTRGGGGAAAAYPGSGKSQLPYNSLILPLGPQTEYLPPFVSGISNRCKNLIKGYRDRGHRVSVYSLQHTDCNVVVPSIPNPFYNAQRMFLPFPPLALLFSLLNPWKRPPCDVVHLFGIFAFPNFRSNSSLLLSP